MADLPDYENPPVVEVAACVQFAPIKELAGAHLGAYWARIRDPFSRVQEQSPMAHVVEPEDLAPARGAQIEFAHEPPLPRTWFSIPNGTELIQVQRDRFVYNWRKQAKEDVYPRFPYVQGKFREHWSGFRAFLTEEDLPEPTVDQCELTYVNLIPKGEGWKVVRDWENVFSTFVWGPRSGFLPPPERVTWKLSFKLPTGEGRLHVSAEPVFVPPGNELAARFTLTVRGGPQGEPDDDKISNWFATAREWIVRGFADLVTEAADKLWGRKA